MKVSVVIPTYQGVHKIVNCIKALKSQSFKDFELIVAIDGSTDNTEEIVKTELAGFSNYKIVTQRNKGRAAIRNLGAKSTDGDLLIFFDDDMRPSPDAIEKHFTFHLENINSVLQGVQVSDEKLCNNDVQKYKSSLEKKWEKKLTDNGIDKNYPYLSASHFSIPKDIFLDAKGFDEKLTDAEDFDLAIRLLENGHNIHYDNSNRAYHDDFINLKTYISRKREYAKAQTKLNALYPERYFKYSHRNFTARKGWKVLIYNILSSRKLVSLIDKEQPLIMLIPTSMRYKMYDLIIQGLANYYPNRKL